MQRRRCPSPIFPMSYRRPPAMSRLLLDLFETFQIRPANVSNAGRARDVPRQFLSSSTAAAEYSLKCLLLVPSMYQSFSMETSSVGSRSITVLGFTMVHILVQCVYVPWNTMMFYQYEDLLR